MSHISRPPLTEQWLLAADRHRHLLLVLVVAVYLIGFNGQWRLGADSALHVLIAQQIDQGHGYTHPTGHQNHVNPGLAYLTAGTFALAGSQSLWTIHLVMLGLGLASLGLTWLVVRLAIDRPTAVVAVVLLALAELFYHYAFEILTDMPFLVGALLFLVGWELVRRDGWRPWLGGAAMVASVAVMAAFRSVVLTFLLAAGLAMVVRMVRGPHRGRYALLAAGAILAILAMRGLDPRNPGLSTTLRDETMALRMLVERLPQTLERTATRNLPDLLTEQIAEGALGADFGPWLSVPLGLAVLSAGLALVRVRPLWALLVAVFFAQWALLMANERYLLVLMPLLAVGWWRMAVTAELWVRGAAPSAEEPAGADPPRLLKGASPAREAAGGVAGAFVVMLWLIPNTISTGRFVLEQHREPFVDHYEDGRYARLARLAEVMHDHVKPTDLVIAEDAQQLMYLSSHLAIEADSLPIYGKRRMETRSRLDQADQLWVVKPLPPILRRKLTELGVQTGPPVTQIAGEGKVALTLHRARVAPLKPRQPQP